MTTLGQINGLIAENEAWRVHCMNLIASENAISPAVRAALDNDFVQRYGNYAGRDITQRRYTGNQFIEQIEVALEDLVRDVFHAREVELRAISGHVAGLAVIMATCKPGDTVVELASIDGGHGLAFKAAQSPLIDLNVVALPFDSESYNIDVEATRRLMREQQPRLIILGSSNFLFPYPVRELVEAAKVDSPNTIIAYDASHVLGLIACGAFQDPLSEGAPVMFGSTHKTLPGPQGGLILGNDAELMDKIGIAVYPGIVTNHHLMRSPALAITLLEMQSNPDYAAGIVANARALARRLEERGIPVIAARYNYTQSHTILLASGTFGTGKALSDQLEAADIMTSYTKLPKSLGSESVRLGTSEVTRLGATEADMSAAADIIADVMTQKLSPDDARPLVHEWAQHLGAVQFADIS